MLRNLLRRLSRPIQRYRRATRIPSEYVRTPPSPQNAIDIFRGNWWSQFPEPYSHLHAGKLRLFDDPRIAWAVDEFGGAARAQVLELGPLEGMHTYMLHRAGAAVTSIEANPEAYLKCLVTKETLDLTNVQFLCGDFLGYLRASPPHFDAAVASGVLYHMTDPVELLALLARVAPRLFLWTHYYDAGQIRKHRALAGKFAGQHDAEHAGFRHRLFRYEYWSSFGARQFCGGSRPHAHWMAREEILGALQHFGYRDLKTNFEAPEHPDGPAFAVFASR